MVESEESFISSLEPVLDTMEQLLKFTISEVISNCKDDLEILCRYHGKDTMSHLKLLEKIVNSKFQRMTFEEASNIVKENSKFTGSRCETDGFNKEHELYIVEKLDNDPVFIVDWPTKMKPFYMKQTTYSEDLVRHFL